MAKRQLDAGKDQALSKIRRRSLKHAPSKEIDVSDQPSGAFTILASRPIGLTQSVVRVALEGRVAQELRRGERTFPHLDSPFRLSYEQEVLRHCRPNPAQATRVLERLDQGL